MTVTAVAANPAAEVPVVTAITVAVTRAKAPTETATWWM